MIDVSQTESEKDDVKNVCKGFTLVEVLIAASIMIILAVGTLSVFAYAVKINTGNNFRSQALTVLQAEVEYYRSLKFLPDASSTDPLLNAGTRPTVQRTSADGTVFNVSVTVANVLPAGSDDTNCTLKQIEVTAVMANPQPGWLANLQAELKILRVRAN